MAWIYEALEMHDRRGRRMGKFRVVRWLDSDPEKMQGLCDHSHATPLDALNCPVATRVLDEQFSDIPHVSQPKLN